LLPAGDGIRAVFQDGERFMKVVRPFEEIVARRD